MTLITTIIFILQIIVFAGILIYILLFSLFFIGWFNQKPFISQAPTHGLFVSIIICFRNEETNLPELLTCLKKQQFDQTQFELILIDDHSTDSSFKLAKEFSKTWEIINIYQLPVNIEGKKNGLRLAIERSKGELIITTDADCRMNPEWLSTIVSFREKTNASFIIAPVVYNYNNSFFEKIQALEFASLIASGVASANLGMPIMCNGANLAFLKSVYPVNTNALEPVSPSGDDMFLLLHLKKTNRREIRFLKSSESIVYTTPSKSMSEFISQRKRWYSKSSLYTDFEILVTGIIVTYSNFSLFLAFVLCLLNSVSWKFFLWIFLAKLASDIIFLYPYLGFIKSKKLLWLAPILEILYPIYIFYIIISSRIQRYVWKDRKY